MRVATRSIGTGDPLVLLQRFRGTLDDWDPALVSALARDRQVILFDSVVRGRERGRRARFGGTDGGLRRERHSIARAERGRFLGYSLGGFVAQVLAIKYSQLVRKLILAATMPPGGAPSVERSPAWLSTAQTPVPSAAIALSLFYTETTSSRSAAAASFGRMVTPPPSYASPKAMDAQARALSRFADGQDGWYVRLNEIAAPTFAGQRRS